MKAMKKKLYAQNITQLKHTTRTLGNLNLPQSWNVSHYRYYITLDNWKLITN